LIAKLMERGVSPVGMTSEVQKIDDTHQPGKTARDCRGFKERNPDGGDCRQQRDDLEYVLHLKMQRSSAINQKSE
jgi:hypothetical protein